MNKEIQSLKDDLFFLSLKKEQKQQNYINKLQEQHNNLTGQTYKMSYNLKQKQMQNVREKQQVIYSLVAQSKQKNLVPLFLTWTIPSEYHPLIINHKTKKIIKKNPKFKFKNIDKAIKPGYELLKKTFREFYKQIKKIDKEILYFKIYEPHKTLVCHLHCLLFVSPDKFDRIKKVFKQTIKNNKLQRVDFDETLLVDNIRNPQAYAMKYLFKTTLAEDDFKARWLDGWRRKYQIRLLETTRLPMSLEVYRSLYYSLDENDKKEVDKIINYKCTKYDNFYEYFMDNTDIDIQIVNEQNNLISHKQINQGVVNKIA
jgi:hypothetical protein